MWAHGRAPLPATLYLRLSMKFNPGDHHRHSIRLPDYDYTQNGAYFVTLCVHQRQCLFGDISDDGKVHLNEYGTVVQKEWLRTETIRPEVELGEFVVMPNHFHAIVIIRDVGAHGCAPLQNAPSDNSSSLKRQPRSLGSLVAGFKSITTKRINILRSTASAPVWQRNYYEHVIRNARDFSAICAYILNNPARWMFDRENPAAVRSNHGD